MKRYSQVILALVACAVVALLTACSGGDTSSATGSGGLTLSDGTAEATLMTPENQLDGYELGEYKDPGRLDFGCKQNQQRVALDDLAGVTREVDGENVTMTVHFSGQVPDVIMITPDYQTVAYLLDAGTRNYTLNLGYAGFNDDNLDGSFADDIQRQYGVDHPINHDKEPLFTACVS